MPGAPQWIAFALVALGMALTPGPNMIYLISRSISQGPRAGLISLGGVAVGFLFYMLCAALGITALLMAVPLASWSESWIKLCVPVVLGGLIQRLLANAVICSGDKSVAGLERLTKASRYRAPEGISTLVAGSSLKIRVWVSPDSESRATALNVMAGTEVFLLAETVILVT